MRIDARGGDADGDGDRDSERAGAWERFAVVTANLRCVTAAADETAIGEAIESSTTAITEIT